MFASKSGRTTHAAIGMWYQPDTGHIHLSIEGQGLCTLSNDPTDVRGHPHLYTKLANVLREKGVEHPNIEDCTALKEA